jgi:hypothetical protein
MIDDTRHLREWLTNGSQSLTIDWLVLKALPNRSNDFRSPDQTVGSK